VAIPHPYTESQPLSWRGCLNDPPSPTKTSPKGALGLLRKHYNDKKISKWDILYDVNGVLHHPEYREKYAENLKRELPRIPLAKDFRDFAEAGKELARLHIGYESLEPWPLNALIGSPAVRNQPCFTGHHREGEISIAAYLVSGP